MDSPPLARGFAPGQPNLLSASGLFFLFVSANLASNPYGRYLINNKYTEAI